MLVEGELAILGLQVVNVNGTIRGLGGYKLVERIPSNPLNVVVVLCNLADHLP